MSRKQKEKAEASADVEEAETAVAETEPSAEDVAQEETEEAEGSSCEFAFDVGARLVVKGVPEMPLKVLEQVATADGPCYAVEVHDPRCAEPYREQVPEGSLEAVEVVEPEA